MKFDVTELKDVVDALGAVVIEATVCPKCHAHQYHAHPWAEALTCQTPGCKQRYMSNVPRRPEPGEPTEKHYNQVLETLKTAWTKEQREMFPQLTAEELKGLTPEVKHLLARCATGSSLIAAMKIEMLAQKFAEQDV
jgi:hypothetical protein